MAIAQDVLLGSFWSVLAQACLVAVGLLVAARLVAYAVRPGLRTSLDDDGWLVLSWTGMVLILTVVTPWTIFAVAGHDSLLARRTSSVMVTVTAVFGIGALVALAIPLAAVARSVEWTLVVASGAGLLLSAVTPSPLRGYISTGALSVAGVVAFGVGLGIRLRLRLTVCAQDGKEDLASAGYVVSRISTMGTNRPRGLAAPQGSDVTSLPDSAVAALPPQGQMAAGLVRFALLLLSIAPWRADIVLIDGTTASVNLRRNGGSAESTLIFRSELGLSETVESSGKAPTEAAHELLTAAAAFILIRLSERHTVLRKGLCGTEHWRSLACQVLAGTPPWDSDPAAAEQLFATAVEKDPGNEAAWLGYLHYRRGASVGTVEDQRRYVDRLKELFERLRDKRSACDEGYYALFMRAAHVLAAAGLNLSLLATSRVEKQYHLRESREVCCELSSLIGEIEAKAQAKGGSSWKGLLELARQMKPTVDLLKAEAENRSKLPVREREYRPSDYYTRACVKVSRKDYPGAVQDLDRALGLKSLQEEAVTDPSLRPLWRRQRYAARLAALVCKPQLADVQVLKPYANRLCKIGIRYPDELIRRETDPANLANTLGVPYDTARWIWDICLLIVHCHRPEMAVPWTDFLTREGIDSIQDLGAVLHGDAADERQRLVRRAWTTRASPITPLEIRRWLHRAGLGETRYHRSSRPAGAGHPQ